MLGLTQFLILLYIKKQSEKGRVEISTVQEFAKRELGIRSTDQTNITVQRLVERDLLERLPCKTVKYIPSEDNEAVVASMLTYCDRAIKLAV